MNRDAILEVPKDLIGYWHDWNVAEFVDDEANLGDEHLSKLQGLFLGFGSGDRKEWAKVLPTLSSLKYLVSWTGANPQSLLDAICRMTWLKRLCIGKLSARNLSPIASLQQLEYLCISHLMGERSLVPLVHSPKLVSLELGVSPASCDFSCFSENDLPSIRAVKIVSTKVTTVQTIRHFEAVQSLEYLSLPTIRTEDGDLRFLTELRNLRLVVLTKKGWRDSEIEVLRENGVQVALR